MKNGKYIVLGLLMSMALSVNARSFEAGERLYFNGTPSSAGWWMDHTSNPSDPEYTRLWAYFFNDDVNASYNKWVEATKYNQTVFYVEPNGNWKHVILTRHRGWVNDPRLDDNCLNKTGYIDLNVSDKNYMENFYYGDYQEDANWWIVTPTPDQNVWSLSYDNEQICTSAAGTEYILAPKNYDYERSKNHAWFAYSGGTWVRLDSAEFRAAEGPQDYMLTLGAAYSDNYYYLQAGKPTGCRLIRIRLNQDCSEGAEGACKITSFVAVAADANVTDQTSAVNGVVAFDDKVNAGQLKIWSPNIDTVIINNEDIETPQTFKLKGFDASSTKTYTLYAKFLGDATGDCEASCSVTVTPPAVSPIVHTTTGTAADPRLVRFTEEDVTLTPDNQTSTYFQWTNSANDDKINGTAQDNRNLTFDAPAEEQTIEYVFLATQDPPEPAGNLIVNGDMEYNGNFTSSYTYWGIDIHEFPTYSDPTKSEEEKSGGYTLTKNSHDFYHTYNEVTPHSGSYFGLFDSKPNGQNQAAWVASTADNPNLKVEAGVSYMFSFWVANVNNFGEMDNGARLQFQISYNGGSTWNNIGEEINLKNYRDNRWHGMSSITTPTAPSDNVKIRVINHNVSAQNRGNDFALDDIRFEAITANTANIAALEHFPVTYHKCVINNATFAQRQPNACGGTVADVDYTISFIYPRGDLYIYEGTTELAHIAHADLEGKTSYSGTIKDQPVDNAEHELTVYFLDDNNFRTDAPEVYKYQAKEVPSIALKGVEWGVTSCGVPTVTLTADIYYTNQNGELTVSVDNLPGVSATYSIEKSEQDSVTVVIPGITADGATGHVLHVSFAGSHGCTDAYVIAEAAPPAPSPCEIYYDTICVGEPYNEHGFDIDNTLPVGTHYFKNAIGEELYLTVADAKDMYSKWTDVLFISNPNGKYIAYQWFKNGQPMQGETLQRLYDPNGMAGTNDLYHCQMTLADGSVITTCPQTFDQTQRSAEASKNGNNQQQVIRRYRVSEHVYIIQTICGDRVETQKIFTSYE